MGGTIAQSTVGKETLRGRRELCPAPCARPTPSVELPEDPAATPNRREAMTKLRVFVSSVQKELEHERAAVAQLISVDPFLLKHCEDGYFVVTFPGPNGNYDRIKTPEGGARAIPAAVESQLNKRQRDMVARMVRGEELTSRICQKRYQVTPQALHRDFQKLISLDLADAVGSGRSARYVLKPRG